MRLHRPVRGAARPDRAAIAPAQRSRDYMVVATAMAAYTRVPLPDVLHCLEELERKRYCRIVPDATQRSGLRLELGPAAYQDAGLVRPTQEEGDAW